MKRFAVFVALVALAACSAGRPGDRDLRPVANPSAVIATELAFARTAQERGQWTAFRQFAAREAVMFVPEPVNAQEWLRRQTDPPQAVQWQPHQVWSSCDGTIAATRGAWQRPDGSHGFFTTIWQRQDRGVYRWVLDHGDSTDEPLAAPEMIAATTADCGGTPATGSDLPMFASGKIQPFASKASDDHTLLWSYNTTPDGSREVIAMLWNGTEYEMVVEDRIGEGN